MIHGNIGAVPPRTAQQQQNPVHPQGRQGAETSSPCGQEFTLIQTVTLGALAPTAKQSTKLKGQTSLGVPAGGRIFAVFVEGGLVHDVVSPGL